MTTAMQADEPSVMPSDWPEMPYPAWRDTLDTLHMDTQIIGKIRLALAPMEPEWNQVALKVTSRGLYSPPLRASGRVFDIDEDLTEHRVRIRTADPTPIDADIALSGRPVAEFYHEMMAALAGLGLDLSITLRPVEVPDPIPFPEDVTHRTYDQDAVARFARLLGRIQTAMLPFHARFGGRTTDVQFFWGSFDLCCVRYSGRPAKPPPGADIITRYASDAEYFSTGFWPGDERLREPAFFSYAYPQPAGLEAVDLPGLPAFWSADRGLFILRYEDVRTASDPDRMILDFANATYTAVSRLAAWSPDLVWVPPDIGAAPS